MAVHYGISLARKYGAKLYVLHMTHNPFGLEGFSLAIPSLRTLDDEWEKVQHEAKAELDRYFRTHAHPHREVLEEHGAPLKRAVISIIREGT